MSAKRYASAAEKQKAYRSRKKAEPVAPVILKKTLVRTSKPVVTTSRKCAAYVPFGTKCKLCGKAH